MSGMDQITVTFWGVRGSYPAPGPGTVRYGGNTPCVQVQVGNRTIVLDAGTGIIALGRELMRRAAKSGSSIDVTLFFSHMHHDHTQGFPFFAPAFMPSTRLYIFGPHTFERDLEGILAHNMVPPVFPVTLLDMSAFKDIRGLNENQVILLSGGAATRHEAPQVLSAAAASRSTDAIRIRLLRSYAHPGGVLIYRIEWRGLALVYATDTEGYANTDQRLVEFARGANLLIHDAQYTQEHYLGLGAGGRSTQGWGHSTAAMACDVARSAGVNRLALFHFEPGYDDETLARIEARARELFEGAFAAREGMQIALERAPLQHNNQLFGQLRVEAPR
ncbi:MAG: MBL fold metallo-hydrolase [Anaerolineales bacterium]|nr:MBL fold metallo-hydrolase [Anaerolineales bacterium]